MQTRLLKVTVKSFSSLVCISIVVELVQAKAVVQS